MIWDVARKEWSEKGKPERILGVAGYSTSQFQDEYLWVIANLIMLLLSILYLCA